ncbi:malonate decarboxylase subunit epsilon [Geobacillus subterraneus]|uniref:malonate decarboxylase subunit epsilon n=1 Tax=Geobacillus subterraneus TaxID=129338 RepID=UPI001607AD4D
MAIAFLFPGQGSQQPNMLHDLPPHPAVEKTLEEASEVLKEDILQWDSQEALQSTVAVQVSLFVAGVAVARALEQEGVLPDMVAGHSVGAFGAAVIAKSLTFREAVSLVKLRGELMERAYPNDYGMGVIVGMEERQLNRLVANCFTDENPIYLTNRNAPRQITVSGSVRGIEKLLMLARDEGASKAELLHVRVPSHCVLMKPISEKLRRAMETIPFQSPKVPYIANRTARPLRDGESIKEDLAFGVAYPVRWYESVCILAELGVQLLIEMPPKSVLTSLAQQVIPCRRSLSVEDNGMRAVCIVAKRIKETSGR